MKYLPIILTLGVSFFSATGCLPTYATDEAENELFDMSLEELMQVKVVSEATGSKQTVLTAPAIVKIITAADIKAMGATDLDEVLQTVPEVHVTRSNLAYNPIYLLRGNYYNNYENPNVLVLINNIPINLLQYGHVSGVWGGMPVNAIARIEVIRGTGATVHADAFVGAINIVTKGREDIQGTEVGTRLGSFHTKEGWVLHGANYGGFNVAATLEYQDTDGPKEVITEDWQTVLDKRLGTHASWAPGPINTQHRSYEARLEVAKEHWQWRAGLQQRDHVGRGAGVILALDPFGLVKAQRLNTDLTYHHPQLATHWELTAQASYYHDYWGMEVPSFVLPPGTGGGAFPEGKQMNTRMSEAHTAVNLFTFYTGWPTHTVRVEAGYTHADLYNVMSWRNYNNRTNQWLGKMVDFSDTPYSALPEMTRRNWRLFIQDAWQFHPQWELTVAWRHYNYSDFGNTDNPNLGLVWHPSDKWTAKLLYARAFRAPSFAELYAANATNVGNPQLKPELIDTLELALDYQVTSQLQFTGNMFYNRVTDSITTTDIPNQLQHYQNSGTRTGYGLSLAAQWKPSKNWTLQGHYDFQTATDQDSRHIPNSPRQKFYLRTDWRFLPGWNLNTQANWVGSSYRSVGDSRPPISAYTTVDVTLRYQQEKQPWEVGLSVRNLLDTDAYEPSSAGNPTDLPLAGRSVWGEVRYRFK